MTFQEELNAIEQEVEKIAGDNYRDNDGKLSKDFKIGSLLATISNERFEKKLADKELEQLKKYNAELEAIIERLETAERGYAIR